MFFVVFCIFSLVFYIIFDSAAVFDPVATEEHKGGCLRVRWGPRLLRTGNARGDPDSEEDTEGMHNVHYIKIYKKL